ncbi:TRAP transporter small permease [Hoeflea sp.]|uniref:TRAP transporter small permease n=1 Tax=Hoeflea sp. TaxID=1940281 RepID=UPI003A9189D5
MTYDMTSRTFWGVSLPWSEEFARVLLIMLVYLSAIGLTRRNDHIRVEFIVSLLGERAQKRLGWFADFLCLVFTLSATWLGVVFVKESIRFNLSFAHSNLPFPVWVAQLIVPIAFALISLRLILRLLGAGQATQRETGE